MLIGIDASRALRAERTGTERYSLEIIRGLLATPESTDHTWRLYVDSLPPAGLWESRDEPLPPTPPDICLLPQRRAWTHRALSQEMHARPPDVLFVPAHVLPVVLPGRRLPPSVVTVHDIGYRHLPRAHPLAQRFYLEASTRWNARAATRLICVSRTTAADVQRFYGVSADKIDTVYEAAAPARSVSDQERHGVRERYGLQRPYALFVGTLQPRKNIQRIIDAFSRLCTREEFDLDLVLAGGTGWLNRSILDGPVLHSLLDRIRMTGFVPEDDLPALMAEARLFCFPSLFEGFGLPVLEAQQYGVPVLTANNSSLPEVAGDAAILVDPTDTDAIADAMLRLSQDEALRQRLIAAGHENVKRFSWEKAARQTLDVLKKAAGQS